MHELNELRTTIADLESAVSNLEYRIRLIELNNDLAERLERLESWAEDRT